jgi:hypothetical protein
MPRKTLALISGLVLVTVVLFVVAFRAGKQQQAPVVAPSPAASNPSSMVPAHTALSMTSEALTVASGQQGKVDVNIDTSDNAVTAVQLELQYDPMVVSNVQVASGPLFPSPVVLINKNDPKTGRVTYAFGILPNHPTVQGTGSIATITFTAKGAAGKQAEFTLLPSTLVTARGVSESVLKSSEAPAKATITIGSGSAPATTKSY